MVPQGVKDRVAKSIWKAPEAKDLNHTPKGKAADKSKRWRYVLQGQTQPAASTSPQKAGGSLQRAGSTTQRTATSDGMATTQSVAQPVTTVDNNVPAPGLGIKSSYQLQDFTIRDGLGLAVNLGNGNLVVRGTDLSNNSPGQAVVNDRFYNSLSGRSGAFGKRWSLSGGHDVGLEIGSTGIVFRGQSGLRAKFNVLASGGSQYVASIKAELKRNTDGTYKLVAKGSRTTMTFDSGGNLTKVTDRNGVGISYFYEPTSDGAGQRVASVSDAVGCVTTYSYDSADRITAITDSAGRRVAYGYDANGNLVSSINAVGQQTDYSYDAAGRLCRITTARGVTVDITYDSTGRATSVSRYEYVGAGGAKQTTSFAYASGSTVVTNPLGNKWTHTTMPMAMSPRWSTR